MYLEPILNKELEPFGLSAVWDGNDPEPGEDVRFYVCTEDDDTRFELRHGRGSTDIMGLNERGNWSCYGYATTFTELAPLLAEIVRDDQVAA